MSQVLTWPSVNVPYGLNVMHDEMELTKCQRKNNILSYAIYKRREIKGGSGASQGGDKNDWPGANEVTWGETANIHKVKQCPTSDNK